MGKKVTKDHTPYERRKKIDTQSLPDAIETTMIRALASGAIDDDGRALLGEYIGVPGCETVNKPLIGAGLTNAEFEIAIMNIRRKQFQNKI